MSDLYEVSVSRIREQLVRNREAVVDSLATLKNEHGEHGDDHRRLIAFYDRLLAAANAMPA